jgi:CheY-like chemotaxis protein
MGEPQTDLTGIHILIVEDDFFIADDMAQAFEQLGAQIVGPVSTIREALLLLGTADGIDAAVLDVDLHGEMSFPVADALKARGVPFVFATGYDRWVVPEKYQDVRRCEKPVTPAKIAQALVG